MQMYLKAIKQYADFNSRASRREYWMFTLLSLIISVIAIVIDVVLGSAIDMGGFSPLYIIYFLGIIIPTIAVAVRRLHDVGNNGLMILISLVPIVGSIWLLVLLVSKGHSGENKYGPNPYERLV